MGLIDRYILRTIATPLVLALCIAGMLLLLEQMLRLFDFVLVEQGPVGVVWRMLLNLLPHYFGLALPLGAFLGILLAFRNLSISSELDALNSSGASFGRLMRPVYMLVFALMIVDFVLVAYLQPFARYNYSQIRFDVTSGAFGIKIPQGEFVEISDDVTIRMGSVDPKTRLARQIFLEMREENGERTVVTAEEASISTTPDITRLLLKMSSGRQLFIGKSGEMIRSLGFDAFDLEIDLPIIGVFRARGGDDEEATFSELVRYLQLPPSQNAEMRTQYEAGLHWRLIHPLTFLVMPILGVAMGVTGRRRTTNLRPIIGIAILIIYHELLEEWGKVAASEGAISPYISMWGLFFAFLGISVFLYMGSIEKARTAKVMARRSTDTIRISTDGSVSQNLPVAQGDIRSAVN